MSEEKPKYQVYYKSAEVVGSTGSSEIILSVDGQTEEDTWRLFMKLKKEMDSEL